MKKQADDNQIMLQTPLFAGADAVLLQQLLNSPGVSSSGFAKGEEIYTPAHFSNRIGILLKGAAIVEKRCGESRMLMSILKKGDLFGAATLFLHLDDTYLVSIRAVEDVRALFIEEAALLGMMQQHFWIASPFHIAQLTHGARCVTHTVRCACVKQALDHRRSPPRQPFRRR